MKLQRVSSLLRRVARGIDSLVSQPAREASQQVNYYTDDIPKRDALIREIYSDIDAGASWQNAIRKPAATRHGERVAEYAFAASILNELRPSSILDVGCVMNNPVIADRIDGGCRVHFLNPGLEPVIYHEYAYFKMPLSSFQSGWKFPFVTCLSTLEHIGFDNTRYGVDEVDQGWDWLRCVDEIVRSVKRLLQMTDRGGRFVISCPYGRKEFVLHPPETGVRTAQVLHLEHVQALQREQFSNRLDIQTLRLDDAGWLHCAADATFRPYGAVGPGASGLIFISGTGI